MKPVRWSIHKRKTESKKPRRKYRTSEKALRDAILQYLNFKGVYAWKQNTGAMYLEGRFIRFAAPGMPDIIGIMPDGRFLAVETKATGRVTAHQKAFLDNVRQRGGIAILAYSVDDVARAVEDRLFRKHKQSLPEMVEIKDGKR